MPATMKIKCAKLNDEFTVKIRHGLIERLGIEILRLNEERDSEVLLITDEKISNLYLKKVILNFHQCPKPEDIRLRICELFIELGEDSKNFSVVPKLLEDMSGLGLSKNCIIAAIGGRTVCNAAAFAAGCYMGGVRLILVPTTLGAMIDSSIIGRAFLNLHAGKKTAGISYNPSLVLCDIDSLKTLPPEEYETGIAELFNIAKSCGGEILRFFERGEVSDHIEKIIESCIQFRSSYE